MELDLITFLIVCPLVFLGGLVDAVAGGGGLIALPAYLIAGVPAHLALGTNKLSSAMGTVVSAFRLWRAGFLNIRKSLPAIVCSLLGSAAGAHLALLVPERVFELILVGLLGIVYVKTEGNNLCFAASVGSPDVMSGFLLLDNFQSFRWLYMNLFMFATLL